jgi:hypothetical protein
MLVIYNFVTIGYLGFSPQVAWARQWFSTVVVDTDQRLSAELNQAISQKNNEMNPSDRQIILHSWHLIDFRNAVNRYLVKSIWPIAATYGGPTFYTKATFEEQLATMNLITDVAFSQHPDVFVRNAIVGELYFFRYSSTYYDLDVYGAEWDQNYTAYSAEFMRVNFPYDVEYVVSQPSGFKRLAGGLLAFRSWISPERYLGPIVFIAAALLSWKKIHRGQLLSPFSVWWAGLLLYWLGSSLGLAYVGTVELRYVYPTNFIYYLCFASLPYWANRPQNT